MQLRPYQSRVIDLTLRHLADNPESQPIISVATGGGKSIIAASLCEALGDKSDGMVIILTHRKELVLQDHSKLPHHLDAGVFSAGAGKKQLRKITVASFQSIRSHAEKLPRVDWIIVDECHYALKGYAEFFAKVRERNPQLRIIGMTATPYTHECVGLHLLPADKRIFSGICAEVGIGELLREGYLCPLKPYRGDARIDTTGVAIDRRTGDFAQGALQAAVDIDELNQRIAIESVGIFQGRNSIIVFCTGVDHANHLREALVALGENAEVLLGNTAHGERDDLVARFRAGKIRWFISVDVIVVGFDAACVSGICFLRPTKSALVWTQALGRGMRLFDGKDNCLVADFTTNSEDFPPLDEIEPQPPKVKNGQAPVKCCDNCYSTILAGLRICPCCGYEFPPGEGGPERNFDPVTGMLVSGVIRNEDGSKTYPVSHVDYEIRNTAAGAPALVAHYMSEGRVSPVGVDWFNMWHHKSSVSQRDSAKWLRRQVNADGPIPLTAQEALARASFGALKVPRSVTVKPGSPFPIRFGM